LGEYGVFNIQLTLTCGINVIGNPNSRDGYQKYD